jgi:hypothetical protein
MGNAQARAATDWVQQIGSVNLTVAYGCYECGFYPHKSSDFFRLSRSTDINGTEESQGSWVTPCCLVRWKWGLHSAHRLIVVVGQDDQVRAAHIGNATREQEEEIAILKMASLIPALAAAMGKDGKVIGYDELVQAIAILAGVLVEARAEQECALTKGGIMTKTIVAKDPSVVYTIPRYCEHPNLSIQHPGTEIKGLQVKMDEVQTMGTDELQDFIDAAALIFDFSKVGTEDMPKLNKPAKAALERVNSKAQNIPKKMQLLSMLKARGTVSKFG